MVIASTTLCALRWKNAIGQEQTRSVHAMTFTTVHVAWSLLDTSARALQEHHPALRDPRALEERGAVGGLGARRVVHRDERRRHRGGGGLFPRRSAIRARTDRRVLSAQSSRRRLSPPRESQARCR